MCDNTLTKDKFDFSLKKVIINIDYLKDVFVYPEVRCCRVTATIISASKRKNCSQWTQTLH